MKTIIVQKDSPVLRQIAHPVKKDEIQSKRIQNILLKMKRALKKEEDGVAIAAPQIGESLRIFIVSGRIISLMNQKDEELDDQTKDAPDLVFINPIIKKLSKSKKKMEEGCLSVRWLYGQVERSDRATVEAYNELGQKFQKGASGLMAQIFQHEADHLDGVLFIDKALNIEEIPPQKQND